MKPVIETIVVVDECFDVPCGFGVTSFVTIVTVRPPDVELPPDANRTYEI